MGCRITAATGSRERDRGGGNRVKHGIAHCGEDEHWPPTGDRLHLASWHLQKFTLHLDRRRRRLHFAPAYCPHNTYTLNMVVSSHCKRL